MNNDLFEWDVKEQEPVVPSLGEPEPVRRKRHPSSHVRRQSYGGRRIILLLGMVIIVLILAVTVLFSGLQRDKEPEISPDLPVEEEPVTFQFGDIVLSPMEGMPINPYHPDAFRLDEKGRVTYEAEEQRAKAGIDVSTHQKDIDWQAVAADGIEFAILRLGNRGYTEGGLFLDQTFEQNLQGALDAGLEVGVYFFSQAITPEEAVEEADFILTVLDGRELAFPVAFDWEFIHGDEARTDSLDGAMMTRCAATFCKRIKDAGYRPAVYFNRTQGYLHYDLRELKDYDLWLAEYDTVPDFYYRFDMWQYSDSGQVDGIQGNVDLNLSF